MFQNRKNNVLIIAIIIFQLVWNIFPYYWLEFFANLVIAIFYTILINECVRPKSAFKHLNLLIILMVLQNIIIDRFLFEELKYLILNFDLFNLILIIGIPPKIFWWVGLILLFQIRSKNPNIDKVRIEEIQNKRMINSIKIISLLLVWVDVPVFNYHDSWGMFHAHNIWEAWTHVH